MPPEEDAAPAAGADAEEAEEEGFGASTTPPRAEEMTAALLHFSAFELASAAQLDGFDNGAGFGTDSASCAVAPAAASDAFSDAFSEAFSDADFSGAATFSVDGGLTDFDAAFSAEVVAFFADFSVCD